jgi:hypothetical protein
MDTEINTEVEILAKCRAIESPQEISPFSTLLPHEKKKALEKRAKGSYLGSGRSCDFI